MATMTKPVVRAIERKGLSFRATAVLASDTGTPWAERFYAWQDRKGAFMRQ